MPSLDSQTYVGSVYVAQPNIEYKNWATNKMNFEEWVSAGFNPCIFPFQTTVDGQCHVYIVI